MPPAQAGTARPPRSFGPLVVIAAIALWRLAAAYLMPVTQDEAYYFDWARSLAWGYFDHPPGVAFLGLGTLVAPASALAARLGTVITSVLTLLILLRLYHASGLLDDRDLTLALVLAALTLPGLAGGLVATPDTALALCWALALHEALPALRGQRWRWLTAGIAVGLGLLGKYTMVLIGPVLLWAILRSDPRALRTPWPYLGGLLALAFFLPHILWNADNGWLTMRFQLGHGLSTDTGELLASPLPTPASGAWTATAPAGAMTASERIGSVLGYLGTQAGLWGLILLPLLAALVRRRGVVGWRAAVNEALDRPARGLLGAAALFPLLFFALIASFSEVEPNWPAMYLTGAVPLAAIALRGLRPWALAAAAGNLALASLYVFHGATAALPLPDSQQRILRETHGFEALAAEAAGLPGLVFADRYQTAAMLRFYQPQMTVTQWPGITRPSEYLRGHIARPVTLDEVEHAGGFWLVARAGKTPEIPGFTLAQQRELADCVGMPLREDQDGKPPCGKPLHLWRMYHYVPTGSRP